MMVAIIDYDAGNIKSVEKAVALLGQEAVLTRDRKEILVADHVILPGVGNFGDAMEKLHRYGLVSVIRETAEKKIPFWESVWACSSCLRAARRRPVWRDLDSCPERLCAFPMQRV